MIKQTIVFFLYVLSAPCIAQETIESLIQRMKPEPFVQIAYHETRYMGLFDEDWQGSGFLYVGLPNIMLKQQVKPERETMLAEGNTLIYHKPATATYHQLQLDESNPMMASLVAFKAMFVGDLDYLRQFYDLELTSSTLSWALEMRAKKYEPDEEPLEIILQGLSGQVADKITVTLPDGDQSIYLLSKSQQGEVIQQKLTLILQGLKAIH